MAWMDQISEIVSRYTGAGGGTASAPADPHQDYCDVAKQAPSQVVADALAHTFRSEETPSFPTMVSTLFQESTPEQRAGLLKQLLGSIGPAALANVPGLSHLCGSAGSQPSITPEQASQVSPEQVAQAAAYAQRGDVSIVDRVSGFYAKHPTVIKALGGAAITLALQHISKRR